MGRHANADGREPHGRGLSTSQAGRFAIAIATPGPSALNSADLECTSSHQHHTCGHLLAHIVEAGLRASLLVYSGRPGLSGNLLVRFH